MMKIARKHPAEEQRLQALNTLNVLDSSPEKEFDDVTLIASQICGTPISTISLIDDNRQWFKSKLGIDTSETSRDISFCSHTILESEALVVNNALHDDRFRNNPTVTGGPCIRFYAGVPLLSPDGFPVGAVCVVDSQERQITEAQLNALKALSQQVTNLFTIKIQNEKIKDLKERTGYKKTIIENLSEGIMLLDKTGKVLECNPAAAELLGLESSGLLLGRYTGDPGWKNITEDGLKFPETELPSSKCLRTGESQLNVILGIYRTPTDLRWLKINSTPLFLEENTEAPKTPSHVITSFTDITVVKAMASDRRYLEAKLSESSRRSALGEMAGGVAHEINNPLGIIVGKIYLLKEKLIAGTLDQNAVADFEKIESTVERIAKIIKSLKTYSRNAENDPLVRTDIAGIITETLELCSVRFKNQGIEVKVLCDDEYEIQCRPAQICQLLMNVFNNSFDAVQNLSAKWIKVEVQPQDSNYKITVTDSGSGIPLQVAGKIMQPFYSTKEFGKGMGLGLSTALGIAESHYGRFEYDLYSENTSFILTLPSRQPIKKSA